jgi:ACS family glucarate transporter-like MFS transporter/ACS family D-galactonate transporter-like MFS transporter
MQRPTNVRWIVLFGLCLAAGFAYVHRGALGVVESTIRDDLHIDKSEMAWAMSIFFWAYALFQIPTGLLVDRWGARKSLLLFGMMCAATMALSAGTLIVGASVGLVVLIASRALMGVAQAGLFPASTRCIATWFPLSRRASAAGTLQAFMSIGGALGAIITAQLLGIMLWPWVFIVIAIPAVIWSIWFFWWYRDRPDEHPSVNEAERELLRPIELRAGNHEARGPTRWSDEDEPAKQQEVNNEPKGPTRWGKLATSPKLLWLCASQYFRAAAIVFWLAWCPTYLQNVYGLSKQEAGTLTSIPFIGVVLGSFFGGLLADRVLRATGSKRWSRNGVSILTAAIGIGFFLAAYMQRSGPYVEITLLFIAALFTACGNPCSYSVSIDIGGRQMAVVFGAMNMIGNFGSATFPLLVPPWVTWFGWVAIPLLMALVFFLGMVCWLFVNPNGLVLEDKKPDAVVDK